VDPENFAAEVYPCLNAWQAQACDDRLGVLRLFSPLNPTGAYDLLLSHPAHYLVAVRLVELFQQQVSCCGFDDDDNNRIKTRALR
jgi:hypothetical protein